MESKWLGWSQRLELHRLLSQSVKKVSQRQWAYCAPSTSGSVTVSVGIGSAPNLRRRILAKCIMQLITLSGSDSFISSRHRWPKTSVAFNSCSNSMPSPNGELDTHSTILSEFASSSAWSHDMNVAWHSATVGQRSHHMTSMRWFKAILPVSAVNLKVSWRTKGYSSKKSFSRTSLGKWSSHIIHDAKNAMIAPDTELSKIWLQARFLIYYLLFIY